MNVYVPTVYRLPVRNVLLMAPINAYLAMIIIKLTEITATFTVTKIDITTKPRINVKITFAIVNLVKSSPYYIVMNTTHTAAFWIVVIVTLNKFEGTVVQTC